MSRQWRKKAPTLGPPPTARHEPARRTESSSATRASEWFLACGLATVIFFRTWVDGLSFAHINTYFTWAIAVLAVVWAGTRIADRRPLRCGAPVALLGAFVLVGALGIFHSVRYDQAHEGLVIWLSHFLLFVLASNALRSRKAIGLVLGAFAVASFGEATWSILHLNYVLPLTRRDVLNDPNLLKTYFGAQELTMDLAHRLTVNRSFGTFLFPNALAAWLTLGTPFAVGAAGYGLIRVRGNGAKTPGPGTTNAPTRSIFGDDPETVLRWKTFCTVFFSALIAFFTITMFYAMYTYLAAARDLVLETPATQSGAQAAERALTSLDWRQHPIHWGLMCVVLPVLIGTGALAITKRHGLRAYWLTLLAVLATLMFLVQAWALGLTASRGGMLATTTAMAAGTGLAWIASKNPRPHVAGWSAATVALVLILASSIAWLGREPAAGLETVPGAHALQGPEIREEGLAVTSAELANPATMMLRLGYWKTGLRMAFRNILTGVGLTNFATVYPMYQYVDASPVKHAHNDFIQLFAETGIVGLVCFTAFWLYFFYRGICRIRAAATGADRWLFIGLYAGVLAFVGHSLVDFNFSNASLTAAAVLLTGLFYALTPLSEEPAPRLRGPWPAAVILAVALGTVAMSWAPHRVYGLLGDHFERNARVQAVAELLDALDRVGHAPDQANQRKSLTWKYERIQPLEMDRTRVEGLGKLYQARREGGGVPLTPGAPMDNNTWLVITDLGAAQSALVMAARDWLARTEQADRAFPHIPEIGGDVCHWQAILLKYATSPREKQELAAASLDWAEACVERSPFQAIWRDLLAGALFRRGNVEPGPGQLEFFQRGLDELKTATQLYPVEPRTWQKYGENMVNMGRQFQSVGMAAEGSRMEQEGQAAIRRAEDLTQELLRLGLAK